jgi:large subunit ribosomal protein L22
MKIKASLKFARVSPTKAMPFARLLKGLSVADALKATAFDRRKVAGLIGKLLKSAIANIENNNKESAEKFRVEQVVIEQGPTRKGYWSRSRGMARPITKRTSHLRIVLVNE